MRTLLPVYEASPVKRPRSTKAEIDQLKRRLYGIVAVLKEAEKSERDLLLAWAGDFR